MAPDTTAQFDAMALLIFTQAIKEARCGELLTCLFEGGSATVEAGHGLVLLPASGLEEMAGSPEVTDVEPLGTDGPDHWVVRLIVEMQVAGAPRADDAAQFAGGSMALGALDWDDAECQVFAVNDGKESGPFHRTSAYRKAFTKAREETIFDA